MTPDFTALADRYAHAVTSGDILACKQVRQAAQRYLDDKANADWQYRFDPSAANRACQFVSLMPHTKGPWGQRGERIKLEPWQAWLICTVFGFVHKTTGMRRFRRAMTVVPRKNGKSLLSAAIGLLGLVADREYGSEVYSGASTEKQAWEVFGPAKLMAQTPAFVEKFKCSVNAKSITVPDTHSKFEPLIGKPGDGASPSFALVDEYHEHDTAALRDTMLTGMGARQQPLLWVITTAGDNLAGPCYDDILTGRQVLDGIVTDDQLFFVEYTIDPETPWDSEDALTMANPNIGVSVLHEFLEARRATAIRNPRDQAAYRTKHLCQWVNSRSAYFNMASWHKCRDQTLSIEDLRGERCIIGADLASKQDICALQLLFPRPDGSYVTFGRYYLPSDVVNEAGKDHYRGWMTSGRLIGTDGNMVDFQRVMDDLDDIVKTYDVQEFVFDPAQATWVMGELTKRDLPVFQFVQWAKYYSEPMKQVAALIDAGKLRHNDAPNDPMSWMVSNVVARTDAKDQVMPSKDRFESKIDGAVALIMAMARAMLQPENSVYEQRGLLYV